MGIIIYKYHFKLFSYVQYFYFILLFKMVRIGIKQIEIKNQKYEIIGTILDDTC